MSNLHRTINALASEFAHSLLRALRGASLDEILAETAHDHAALGESRPSGRREKSRGVRRRRSTEELDALVTRIVSVLKTHKKGLRAEELREKLGVERKELPRPLAEALKKRVITKKGKKRATTYFA